MAERVLTARELNRAMLARQLLLRRERVSVARAVERLAGLQTQDSRSGYIGLWSRLEGFERDDLTRALERRRVVQGHVMRITVHMVSAKDYWLFTEGIREPRRESWRRSHARRVDVAQMSSLAARVEAALTAGPRPRREVAQELGIDGTTWTGTGMWVDLLRVPPSGTWARPRADLYALADRWLTRQKPSEREGRRHLLRRYLAAFGPATIQEAANWAGLPVRALAAVAGDLRLRRFSAEDGAELLDVPGAPLPDPETPAPPRFLANWDPMLLASRRRTQILPKHDWSKVFNPSTPQTTSVFLIDGVVAGRWKLDAGRVWLEPFGRIPKEARRELGEEAERLQEFVA